MKKSIYLILTCLAIMLSSCILRINLELQENGDGEFSVMAGMSPEEVGTLSPVIPEEEDLDSICTLMLQEGTDDGKVPQPIEEDGYYWCPMESENTSFTSIKQDMDPDSGEYLKSYRDGDYLIFDSVFSPDELTGDGKNSSSPVTFEFLIKMPGRIVEHNADRVVSSGLIWDLQPDELVHIYAKSDLSASADQSGSLSSTTASEGSLKSQPTAANTDQPPYQISYIDSAGLWVLDMDTSEINQIWSGPVDKYDWSADGKRLWIQSNREVFVLEVDLPSQSRVLFQENKDVWEINWSPDGDKLAYCAYYESEDQGYQGSIFLLDLETLELTIFNDQANCIDIGNLAWSPDGKIIHYAEWQTLTSIGLPSLEVDASEISGDFMGPVSQIKYNPRGEWLMTYHYESEGTGTVNIWRSGEKIYTTTAGSPMAEWSPDGRFLAYNVNHTIYPFTNETPLQLFDTESKTETDVYPPGGLNPAWAPDGETLVYVTYRGALVAVDLASLEARILMEESDQEYLSPVIPMGGDKTPTGYRATTDFVPSWSADGSQILYAYPEQFYLVDVTSGETSFLMEGQKATWRFSYMAVQPTPTPTVTHTATPEPSRTPTPTPIPTQTVRSVEEMDDLVNFESSVVDQGGAFPVVYVILPVLLIGAGIVVWVYSRRPKG